MSPNDYAQQHLYSKEEFAAMLDRSPAPQKTMLDVVTELSVAFQPLKEIMDKFHPQTFSLSYDEEKGYYLNIDADTI